MWNLMGRSSNLDSAQCRTIPRTYSLQFFPLEIVVPILANGQVKGVLDIDSNLLNFFDETDRRYLEEVTAIVAKTLYY